MLTTFLPTYFWNNIIVTLYFKLFLTCSRKLLEEIDEALSTGERGEALRKVEHILQHKISQNKKTINELKFEISEYIEV